MQCLWMIFVLPPQNIGSDLLCTHEDAFRWVSSFSFLHPLTACASVEVGGVGGGWNFNVRWGQTHPIPFDSSSSISGLKFYGRGYCLMQSTSGP